MTRAHPSGCVLCFWVRSGLGEGRSGWAPCGAGGASRVGWRGAVRVLTGGSGGGMLLVGALCGRRRRSNRWHQRIPGFVFSERTA
mgnify:CR=1 FL=1